MNPGRAFFAPLILGLGLQSGFLHAQIPVDPALDRMMRPAPLTTPPTKPGMVTIKDEKLSGIVRVRLDSEGFVRIEHDAGVGKFTLEDVPADFIVAWGVIEDASPAKRILDTDYLNQKLRGQRASNISAAFGESKEQLIVGGQTGDVYRNLKLYDSGPREMLDVMIVCYVRETSPTESPRVASVYFGKQIEAGLARINGDLSPGRRSLLFFRKGDERPSFEIKLLGINRREKGEKPFFRLFCSARDIDGGFDSSFVDFVADQLMEVRKIFIKAKGLRGLAVLSAESFSKDLGVIESEGANATFSLDHLKNPSKTTLHIKTVRKDTVDNFSIPTEYFEEIIGLLAQGERLIAEEADIEKFIHPPPRNR
jgi:hypothetical protein